MSDDICSIDLRPGDVIGYVGNVPDCHPDLATIWRRKETDDGWWIVGGGGLADYAFDTPRWVLCSRSPGAAPGLARALYEAWCTEFNPDPAWEAESEVVQARWQLVADFAALNGVQFADSQTPQPGRVGVVNGDAIITNGSQGWGNRKGGCEAYGPGGRWAPARNGQEIPGDLLGDHLDELGAHEGSPFIVIASTSRFDTDEFERELRPYLDRCIEHYLNDRTAGAGCGPQFGDGDGQNAGEA